MAGGGGNHRKSSSHRSASSSSRCKSANTPSTHQLSVDPKSSSNPFPNTGPTPSHLKALTNHLHISPPGAQFPFADASVPGPSPPPVYGFHMLERRTIVLSDGSVRSYFALPSGYRDCILPRQQLDRDGGFVAMGGGRNGLELGLMSPDGFQDNREDLYGRRWHKDQWNSFGGSMEGSMKRKFGEGEEDKRADKREFEGQGQQLLQNGNRNGYPMGSGDHCQLFIGTSSSFNVHDGLRASKMTRIDEGYESVGLRCGSTSDNIGLKDVEVDQNALKKAFLHFVKLLNENAAQRKTYLDNGKWRSFKCIACNRSSKDFPDMHNLIMHTYNSDIVNLRVDHLGLHKALCVLMGWNYLKPPDNSKAYQFLSADEAVANQYDLIMWPPVVIIHNTLTGKGKDGRMEGLGNRAMDNQIRDLGFEGGKSKSLYNRDGHLGINLIKFAGNESGLKEAVRLAEYFERDNHGRKGWDRVMSLTLGKDDYNHLDLVKIDERTKEKKRILFGYLGTAADLDKIDFDTRKKVVIESRREYKELR